MNDGMTRSISFALAALCFLAPYDARAAITSVRVASGLDLPVFATSPPNDEDRLFLVEQHSGKILILDLDSEAVGATPFLTVEGISKGDEQGLLGLAFHPQYAKNGLFYVNVTNASGDTEIRRYSVSGDPDVADPKSATLVLGFDQPQANHNGGWIGFGLDGFLYIASGDGGGGYDDDAGHSPGTGNGQDITDNLLGKILRIDVDDDDFPADENANYAIPASNPFVGKSGDDEIWAYGLRNPWRASFDVPTGRLYIGDVGQDSREEIDVEPGESAGGTNYGWRLREGTIQTPSVGGARPAGAVDPIYDYVHGDGDFEGFVVTGGYVYRGPIAELQGRYFFADYGTERIWSLVYDGSDPSAHDGTNFSELLDRTEELDPPGSQAINSISSFGVDAAGNLYIVDHGGEVFRIEEVPVPTTTSTTVPGSVVCGDPVDDDVVAASDALHVLRSSVGTASCEACVCDVNDNGETTVTDALAVLRVAVGQAVELSCPAC